MSAPGLRRQGSEILGKAAELVHLGHDQIDRKADTQLSTQICKAAAQCCGLSNPGGLILTRQFGQVDRQQCSVDRRTRAVTAQDPEKTLPFSLVGAVPQLVRIGMGRCGR